MFIRMLGTVIIPAAILVLIILYMAKGKSIEYQCDRCGETFRISPVAAIVSPHMMGKKYAKCPRCGTLDWVSPTRRQQ